MIEAELLKCASDIRHGFFSRKGGVSQGIYASLNCGLGSSDDPAKVRENRAIVARQLGAEPGNLVTPRQAHTNRAVVVTEPWGNDGPPEADAVVTNVPGLAVGVLSADCAPVLLADPFARVVAAAHAGWRGAQRGVLQSTVAEMEALGARREHICAVVGPTISAAVYEVGEDFRQSFLEQDEQNAALFHVPSGGERPHFDLPAYVMRVLADAGVGKSDNLALCTHENESLFFSYRRASKRGEPDYGRQISAILVV